MSNFTAFYDACVLYPAPLRDFLMHLALTGLYRAKWSNMVHEEWMRNVAKNRPDISYDRLERTRDLMNAHVMDAVVEEFEEFIDLVELPDENDRHVVAAAIKSNSDVIVTFNLKHFPAEALSQHDLDAQTPDTFITHLLDLDHGLVCLAARRQRSMLQNPSKTVNEFLNTLDNQGLPNVIRSLRKYAELL